MSDKTLRINMKHMIKLLLRTFEGGKERRWQFKNFQRQIYTGQYSLDFEALGAMFKFNTDVVLTAKTGYLKQFIVQKTHRIYYKKWIFWMFLRVKSLEFKLLWKTEFSIEG